MARLYDETKKRAYPLYVWLSEKQYTHENCTLKYIFNPKANSKTLLIIFSGGSPEGVPARYNYVNNVRKYPSNQLYILDDFGPNERGAFYLGQNRDFYIERAVSALIKHICDEYKIDNTNIISCGTSKGGFCALYFAFKYHYGAAVVGAPQILLGDYLNTEQHKYGLEYLAGNTDEESISFLNGLLLEAMRTSSTHPKIYLHCSQYEHHYPEHVLPFLDVANELGVDVTLDLGNYEHHEEVTPHYPIFLRSSLKDYNGLTP